MTNDKSICTAGTYSVRYAALLALCAPAFFLGAVGLAPPNVGTHVFVYAWLAAAIAVFAVSCTGPPGTRRD